MVSLNEHRCPQAGKPVVVEPSFEVIASTAANKLRAKRGCKSVRLFVATKLGSEWVGSELQRTDDAASAVCEGAFICLSSGEDFFGSPPPPPPSADDVPPAGDASSEAAPPPSPPADKAWLACSYAPERCGTERETLVKYVGPKYAKNAKKYGPEPPSPPAAAPTGTSAPGADEIIVAARDGFVFFWLANHPFSNWHASALTLDGVRYSCVEQAYMAAKAARFGDDATRAQILRAATPKQQKALGRAVRGFKPGPWRIVARREMFRAVLAKVRGSCAEVVQRHEQHRERMRPPPRPPATARSPAARCEYEWIRCPRASTHCLVRTGCHNGRIRFGSLSRALASTHH